jgi:uncharacterized membrane protein
MFNTAHIHPMVVHFPIALILAGFLAEVLYLFFKKSTWLSFTGFYLMILGTLGAIVAFASGQIFTFHPEEGEIVAMFEKHETGAWITLIVMVIATIFRSWLVLTKKYEGTMKWISFCLYFIGVAAVSITGFLGGTMVYNFMVGL